VDFAESQRNPGKHPVGLIVVIVLHILLGWALVSGLAKRVVEIAMKPVETKIIEEVKPPPPPPPENLPPPPKNLPPPPAFVPPPEVNIAPQPTPAPAITTTAVAPPPAPPVTLAPAAAPAPPAPPAPKPVARAAQIDVSSCAKPTYPAAAARAEATGTTRIRFSIDGSGQVTKTEIVGSSGASREHRQLDRLAAEALGACKFRPGTDENGRPVGTSTNVDYVWRLE
jgi:periplasmic protein TonB